MFENVRDAGRVLNELFVRGYLKKNSDLIPVYHENQTMINELIPAFDCTLHEVNGALYLIPNSGRTNFGYSLSEFMRKKGARDTVEKYVYSFIMLTVMLTFFDGSGQTHLIQEFVSMTDLANRVEEYLKDAIAHPERDELFDYPDDIPLQLILDRYRTYPGEVDAPNSRTKVVRKVLDFMKEQGLIGISDEDNLVVVKQVFIDKMEIVLSRENYNDILDRFKTAQTKESVIEKENDNEQDYEDTSDQP